ncbi:MAG: type II toxin-antitoxin system HicB family antitoxin [Pirellulales bacterium]|nr:type II toxin-antitoxin system HicB family antitoxin [Pirellulales bacterium]
MCILLTKDKYSIEHGEEKQLYECYLWLCPESEGGYSVVLPELPGVVGQGETKEEAIEDVKEAFQAAAAEYLEKGGRIPWKRDCDPSEKPSDAKEKWIVVHV